MKTQAPVVRSDPQILIPRSDPSAELVFPHSARPTRHRVRGSGGAGQRRLAWTQRTGTERESPRFLAAPRRERRKPLTRRSASTRFHRSARAAGLPLGVTPHRARATSITEALDRKCPIEAVQARVSHRSIATTKRYDPRKLHYRESASFAVRY